MNRVFDVMEKVAQTDATVLLAGETGTGKDLVARAIHYAGARRERRFVAQNCGALPDTLLESELFGHKRGAFTGAHADKKGLFELADGGTIFLDEIGETEPGMQVRLLRVLQDGEIRPLGAAETRKVDVRIIAATNRDLRKARRRGALPRGSLLPAARRRDRAAAAARAARGHPGARPPLPRPREPEDGPAAPAASPTRRWTASSRHDWTGNVRELENEIQRAVALAGDAETISLDMLSEHLRGAPEAASADAAPAARGETRDLNLAVDDLKRRMIQEALRETGSKTRAADRLGIPRQSLQKMMKRLALSATAGVDLGRTADAHLRPRAVLRGSVAATSSLPRSAPRAGASPRRTHDRVEVRAHRAPSRSRGGSARRRRRARRGRRRGAGPRARAPGGPPRAAPRRAPRGCCGPRPLPRL